MMLATRIAERLVEDGHVPAWRMGAVLESVMLAIDGVGVARGLDELEARKTDPAPPPSELK